MVGQTLEQYLTSQMTANPARVREFAQQNARLISIKRRRWRGHVKANDTRVMMGDKDVTAAVTRTNWSMLPDELKEKYAALERSVNDLLQLRMISGQASEDDDSNEVNDEALEAIAMLLRGGLYLVRAANMPIVEQQLTDLQTLWRQQADVYCTEEGYQHLRDLIREKVGDELFSEIERYIPDRNKLSNKFALQWLYVPVQFVTDSSLDKTTATRSMNLTVGAIASLVRQPRHAAAEALEALAYMMVDTNDQGELIPRKVTRRGQEGARSLREESINNCLRGLEIMELNKDFIDGTMDQALAAVRQELPPIGSPLLTNYVKRLNKNDEDVVRVAKLLLTAAAAARNETGMIEVLADKL